MDKQNSGKKQNKQKLSNKNRKNDDNKDNSTTLKASSPPQIKSSQSKEETVLQQKTPPQPQQQQIVIKTTEKTREEILAERELKKQSKLAAKNKSKLVNENVIVKKLDSLIINDSTILSSVKTNKEVVVIAEKSPKQINLPTSMPVVTLAATITATNLEKPKATTSKAERRALQETQRAAKAKTIGENNKKTEKDIIKSKELIERVSTVKLLTSYKKRICETSAYGKIDLFNIHIYLWIFY